LVAFATRTGGRYAPPVSYAVLEQVRQGSGVVVGTAATKLRLKTDVAAPEKAALLEIATPENPGDKYFQKSHIDSKPFTQ
jgi:hypothetical protein